MRLAKTLSLFCAAILMTGCGSGNKEEKPERKQHLAGDVFRS